MCSGLSMTSFDLFETLETKLSCSALGAHATVAASDPAPDPEPDPGPFTPDNAPITYPPVDPSGPVGPGAHAIKV